MNNYKKTTTIIKSTLETTISSLRSANHSQLIKLQSKKCFIPSLQQQQQHTNLHEIELACKLLKQYEAIPIPHLRARGFRDEQQICNHLDQLILQYGIDSLFLVSGDDEIPSGRFQNTLDVLRNKSISIRLAQSIKHLGFPIYPTNIKPSNAILAIKEGILPTTIPIENIFVITQVLWSWGMEEEHWLQELLSYLATNNIPKFPIGLGICGPIPPSRLRKFVNNNTNSGPVRDLIPQHVIENPIQYHDHVMKNMLKLKQTYDNVFIHVFGFGGLNNCITTMNQVDEQIINTHI
jgi:hypothetical protein